MTDQYLKHYKYYKKLDIIFNRTFIQSQEKFLDTVEGRKRVEDFYDFVIPSLASIRSSEKFLCRFLECTDRRFTSRKSLVRHLLCHHANEIPGRGRFLPTCSSLMPTDYICHRCKFIFIRRESYNKHLETHMSDLHSLTLKDNTNEENRTLRDSDRSDVFT